MRDLYFPLLWASLVTIVAATIGHTVGSFLVGWGLALLLLLFIVNYRHYHREQTTLSFTWYGLLFLSYLATLPWGVTVLITSIAFGVYLSAFTIRDLFAGNVFVAVNYIWNRLTGQLEEQQVVESPKKGLQEAIQRRDGPRLVVVPRHIAVRMRRNDAYTRIVGPGTYLTAPFEYVEQAYNLRPCRRAYRFSKILTGDRFALDVTIVITFGINVHEDAWLGAERLTQADRSTINDIDRWPLDWETVVQEAVEKGTRLEIGNTSLEDALNVSHQYNINQLILLAVQNAINEWGLIVHQLELLLIQPDPNVMQAASERYQEVARSQAWAAAIDAIVRAYSEARLQGVPDPVIYREMVRRLFEQAPVSPATRSRLQSELAQIFSTDVDASDASQRSP